MVPGYPKVSGFHPVHLIPWITCVSVLQLVFHHVFSPVGWTEVRNTDQTWSMIFADESREAPSKRKSEILVCTDAAAEV